MDLSLSSSSSSDEEMLEIIEALPEIRHIRPRINLFENYNESEFKQRYRLTKATVLQLLGRFEQQLVKETERNFPISPMNQLLLTLRYYATGTFQRAIGDHVNIHQSTVHRIVHRVGDLIARLGDEVIRMPSNATEINSVMQNFYSIAHFPGVIGVIDGTHIKIISPGGDEAETFRNRKGWFSINVQLICDAKLKIMDINARWAGSVHDSTIFQNSLVRARLEANEFPNGYLLGDGGYTCSKFLLTPLGNPTTAAEERYQLSHIRTRNTVERCIGVLKRRFPVLSVGMQIKLDNVLRVIVATAVLHNLALRANDNWDENNEVGEHEVEQVLQNAHNNVGDNFRRYIINTVFN